MKEPQLKASLWTDARKALSSHPKVWQAVEVFGEQLRVNEKEDSVALANDVAQVMRLVAVATCSGGETNSVTALRAVGRYLLDSSISQGFVIGNVTRRVLKVIREVFAEPDEEFSIQESVKEALTLLADEIDHTYSAMVGNAAVSEQIHSDEVILTYGWSKAVEKILLEAAKKRNFQVIVAEHAPACDGHGLARVLATDGKLDVSVIADAVLFAVMPRVHKVFIGTEAIMANGSLIGPAGTLSVANVARYYAKPLVVCTELYKLTPLLPQGPQSVAKLNHPGAIMSREEALTMPNVTVVNPAADYVPPELISLLLTDIGCCNPKVVYRLVQRFYNDADTVL